MLFSLPTHLAVLLGPVANLDQVNRLEGVVRQNQAAKVDHHVLRERRDGVNTVTSPFSQIIRYLIFTKMLNKVIKQM